MTNISREDLLRIRLTLGLTQRELAHRLDVSQGTIDSLEKQRIQKLNPRLEVEIKKIIKGIKLIDKNSVEDEKRKLKTSGRFIGERAKLMGKKGGVKGAINALKSRNPTKQEEQISSMFSQNRVNYEFNAPIYCRNRTFIVDFVLPNREDPRVFIEVKNLKGTYRKYLQCVELAWRIIQLKREFPESKFYVFISGTFFDSELDIIRVEASRCFINESITNLIKCLKEE
jgi:DNA-binding XRE family transcriptional regulator